MSTKVNAKKGVSKKQEVVAKEVTKKEVTKKEVPKKEEPVKKEEVPKKEVAKKEAPKKETKPVEHTKKDVHAKKDTKDTKKDAKKGEKKEEEQKEQKKEKVFITATVYAISDRNGILIQGQKKEGESNILSLAYVDVPRLSKDKETGKVQEEIFFYEANQVLRKRLIGKTVKFEVVKEMDNGIRLVVPILGKENIIITLLENGYASLRLSPRDPRRDELKEYYDAAEKAKNAQKGMHASYEQQVKVAIKKPETPFFTEFELSKMAGKSVEGYVKKVDAPASYIIETPQRKLIRVSLYGVDQMLKFNPANKRFVLDEDAKDALNFIDNTFLDRDCTVAIKSVEKRLHAIITVDKKDIAEELLKAGFVVCAKLEDASEEIKQKYEAAEKVAKKGKKARWTNFDQALEDAIVAKRLQRIQDLADRKKNAVVLSGYEIESIGKFLVVRKGEQTAKVFLASLRINTKKDDKEFNQLLEFRIRMLLRKLFAGKKLECKQCYEREFEEEEGKKVTDKYYDVYVNKQNIAIQLIKEGFYTVDKKSKDEFYQSFDYKELLEVKEGVYTPKAVTEYKADKDNIKDVYINTSVTAMVERVLSVSKYLIYIPEKDARMAVLLANCRLPRDDENEALKKFNQESISEVRKLVGTNEVTVDFRNFNKGNFLVDITVKKTSLVHYVLDNAFAQFAGKENTSEKNEAAKENSTGIYQFKSAERKTEEVAKPVEKKEFKKHDEIRFGAEQKVYLTGFDGSKVYYYNSVEDTKFIEDMSKKFAVIKKAAFELKVGEMVAVEYKGKWYRANVVVVAPKANILKCVDTGVFVTVGKKKTKMIGEEEKKAPINVKSIGLVAIDCLIKGKNVEFDMMVNTVLEFCNKEASIYISGKAETEAAKVVVGNVCINTILVQNGLATLSRFFKDNTEWGTALTYAQAAAKEGHMNVWRYGEIFDENEGKEFDRKDGSKDAKGKKPKSAPKEHKAETEKKN